MNAVHPPFFFRWLSPKYIVCDLPGEEKVIYLTFDDGPVPEATPEVLTILKKYNAIATFFVTGENVQKHASLFEMVRQQGHAIGNHSFHHPDGWRTSPGAYIDDIRRCRDLVDSRLFRPPYGRFTPSQYFLLRNDFRFILWSVLSCDFDRNTSPERCLQNTINSTRNGSIVVFHENLKSVEKVRFALPRFLEHFTALGYRFEGIGQHI